MNVLELESDAMPFSPENQQWVRDEVSRAINPKRAVRLVP